MKTLFVFISLMLFSLSLHASSGTGGVPSPACVIDGELIHKHLLITECDKLKKIVAEKAEIDAN